MEGQGPLQPGLQPQVLLLLVPLMGLPPFSTSPFPMRTPSCFKDCPPPRDERHPGLGIWGLPGQTLSLAFPLPSSKGPSLTVIPGLLWRFPGPSKPLRQG